MKARWAALIAVSALACGQGPGASPTTRVEAPAPVAPNEEVPVTGEVPELILTAILADASERTEVEVSALAVTRAQAMSWPDGSLGCPEPGMFYLQVITDGYWVEVVAEEERLDYRVDSNGFFRLCSDPPGQPPLGTAPGDTINPTG